MSEHNQSAVRNTEATLVPLERLRPADWNANRVPANIRVKIRRSLERFGVVENLIARPHPREPGALEVISGNHRLEILRDLGHELVPVVVLELDDAQARVLAQTLNRTRGEDDPEAYAALIEDVLQTMPAAEMSELDVGSPLLAGAFTVQALELGPSARDLFRRELLRLKHVTGFSKLFEDVDYRRAWETKRQILQRRLYQERADAEAGG